MVRNSLKFLTPFVILGIALLGMILFSGVREVKLASEEFKCLKCHKGTKSLPNLVQEKNIKSAEDLKFLIRKGPKSGLHVTVPEEDLEKAIQYLNLK